MSKQWESLQNSTKKSFCFFEMQITTRLIANALTLSRIICAFIFALCILYASKYPYLNNVAIIITLIAGISDGLDGFFAKRCSEPSVTWCFLDPIADKTFMLTAFVVITIKYNFSIWAAFLVVSRELVVTGAWLYFLLTSEPGKYQAVPHFFGKLMVIGQISTIICVLLKMDLILIKCAWGITIFFALFSFIIYIIKLPMYRKSLK